MGGSSASSLAKNERDATKQRDMVAGSASSLAKRWREVQGSRNWQGLLDPLDVELRREIIRYGEFAGVPNCAFDDEPRSRNLGNSYFSKPELLQRCGLPSTGYTITRYIYSLSTNVDLPQFIVKSVAQDPSGRSKESNWIGFIMVATDAQEIQRLGRRDIVIVWRGTRRNLEWLEVIEAELIPISASIPDLKAEKGFWSLFTDSEAKSLFNKKSAAQQVTEEVQRLVETYKNEELSITCVGHSLGAALATYSAFHIAEAKSNTTSQASDHPASIPITVFTWGGPREGNKEFKDKLDSLGVHCLRVRNVKDILTEVPPSALGYIHVGVKLEVDYDKSPYLKPTTNTGDWHNLDAYLHLVDGTHGPQADFSLEVHRDLALLNRSADLLLDSYSVPGIWWQVQNKGLVQAKDGKWSEPELNLELYI
ncbi:hypothetical protein O6H91_01G113200 [Diphasiastrum complanatum]|nr:hypothetical protein O6H91_01G113200 [Diphasiastrum complanatum]